MLINYIYLYTNLNGTCLFAIAIGTTTRPIIITS